MKTLVRLSFVFFLLAGCEETNQPEIIYDCVIKSTMFDLNNEVVHWEISYFKNDKLVKYIDSIGDVREIEYDNIGNVISASSNGSRSEYEYDSNNNVVKTTNYINNQLDCSEINIYDGNLLKRSYTLNIKSDTIGFCYYYYNSNNKKDSVICNDKKSYYYYSPTMDSIIELGWKDRIIRRTIENYENGRMTYDENYVYNGEGELWINHKTTKEFNDKGLLTNYRYEGLDVSLAMTSFHERNIFYDSDDNILRTEDFEEPNDLLFYSIYHYEDFILSKVETFDPNGELLGYTLIENNCNKNALLPTWFSQY